MKVEVEIPKGKYCDECDFLQYDRHGTVTENYCNFGGGCGLISVFQCNTTFSEANHPIKHPDCPSLKEGK